MSWYSKENLKNATQYMNVIHLEGVTYQDLKKIFGEPDKIEHYDSSLRQGDVKEAEWVIKSFGYKFMLRPDDEGYTNRQLEAGKKKWKVPSLDDPVINQVEIIGHLETSENIVSKMILVELGQYDKLTPENYQQIIKTIYER